MKPIDSMRVYTPRKQQEWDGGGKSQQKYENQFLYACSPSSYLNKKVKKKMNGTKNITRTLLKTYEDFQKMRIAMTHRVRDYAYKIKNNIAFDEVEEKKKNKSYGKEYEDSKLKPLLDELAAEGKILKEDLKPLINLWDERNYLKKEEDKHKRSIEKRVKSEPIWIEFLQHIKGIGGLSAFRLIKEFGACSGYSTISRLWAHTGYGVNENNRAPRTRKGNSIKYNPSLRSFLYIISDGLMKANKGYYRQLYDEHKEKQQNREFPEGFLYEKYKDRGYKKKDMKLMKGHIHKRALRKMVKRFLSHYWECSRELAGLPIEKSYVEGVLGHNHIVHWREAIKMENTYTPKLVPKENKE